MRMTSDSSQPNTSRSLAGKSVLRAAREEKAKVVRVVTVAKAAGQMEVAPMEEARRAEKARVAMMVMVHSSAMPPLMVVSRKTWQSLGPYTHRSSAHFPGLPRPARRETIAKTVCSLASEGSNRPISNMNWAGTSVRWGPVVPWGRAAAAGRLAVECEVAPRVVRVETEMVAVTGSRRARSD